MASFTGEQGQKKEMRTTPNEYIEFKQEQRSSVAGDKNHLGRGQKKEAKEEAHEVLQL